MMGLPFGVAIRVPMLENPKRPTTRDLAHIIIVARDVQTMRAHAERDQCPVHLFMSLMLWRWVQAHLPWRYARSSAWMDRRVHLPANQQMVRWAAEDAEG